MHTFDRPQPWYREVFWKQLMLQRPSSVLDVGAGRGALVSRLADENVRAAGIDRDDSLVATARAEGLDIKKAEAELLPHGSGAFDWAVSEFSLHHFKSPDAVLREMLRVAQTGVLILDQWFDMDLAHQRVASDFRNWCKERDRARGKMRAPNLQTAALHALMARVAPQLHYTVQTLLMPMPMSLNSMAAEARAYGLAPDTDAMLAFDDLFMRANTDGITHDGAAILTVHLG